MLRNCILAFVQGVWNIAGASNMAYMLAGDVHVMVLTNLYVHIFIVIL